MDVVDASKQVVSVPDAEAAAGIKAGKYLLPVGAKVPMRSDAGMVFEATPEQAYERLHNGTGTFAGAEALAEKQHETVGSYAAAGAEGFGRGLTGGLMDPAAIAAARAIGGDAAAEKTRQHLAEQKQYHPYVSTGAEVAGNLTALAGTGGASELAEGAEGASLIGRGIEAAGTPVRALGGLGRAAERGVAAILPEAESMAGKALAKAASGAAGAGVENAGLEVGHAISEDSLNGGDHQLTAEQLMAAAGHGFLLGGFVGGATHGLGSLASSALEGPRERMTGFLRNLADRQAGRAIGVTEEAAADVGGAAAVGRTLHEEGIIGKTLKDSAVKAEELAPRIDEAIARTNQKIEGIISKSDATMRAADVVDSLDARIAQHTAAGNAPLAEHLQTYRDHLLKQLHVDPADITKDVPIKDVFAQRRELEGLLEKRPAELGPDLKAFHKELANAEVNALESGGHVQGELLALQAKAAHLQIAQKSVQQAEKVASTTAGHAAGWVGGGFGAAVGGAVGGGMGAFVGRSIGRDLARSVEAGKGQAVGAYALDKIHHLIAADNAVRSVTETIDRGLRGYVSRTAEAVARTAARPAPELRSSKPLPERFQQRVEAVRAMADPAVAHERLTASIGTLAQHAPKLAGVLAATATSDAQYLQALIPPSVPGPSLLQPQLKAAHPSESSMAQFLRISDLIDRPLTAIDKLKKGTLLQDEADALRTRRPGIFGQMQDFTMKAIADRSTMLPYDKRRGIGILLGIDTDASLKQGYIAAQQQSYQGKAETPPHVAPGKPLDLVHMTDLDRIEQGVGVS